MIFLVDVTPALKAHSCTSRAPTTLPTVCLALRALTQACKALWLAAAVLLANTLLYKAQTTQMHAAAALQAGSLLKAPLSVPSVQLGHTQNFQGHPTVADVLQGCALSKDQIVLVHVLRCASLDSC